MRTEVLRWAGGEHEFGLSVSDLEALQDRCGGDGVFLVYNRIVGGIATTRDILATTALGLEGPEMSKIDAVKLVRGIAEDQGLNALLLTAQAVLGAALMGWPDQEPGEDRGETPKTSS